MKVWELPLRLLHWTLAMAVAAGWLTTLEVAESHGWSQWHQPAGWLALAVVVLRLAWSRLGGRHARFSGFVRSPRATLRYARSVWRGTEPRYLGHNPLGGWMIVALLLGVAALAASGWLYTTDAFWGDETVDAVHQALAWTLLVLVALHLAGVVFTSRRQRENLVAAMFSGVKADPRPGDEA